MKNINIKTIRIDGETQSRVRLDEGAVADYTQVLRDGGELPPVVVFFDGADNWLADGFHRYHAYSGDKRASIPADVRSGTRRDAMLFSFGANGAHGLRRTNDDKRKAVSAMLADAEWSKWSTREIGAACHVSHDFVARLKSSLSSDDSEKATTYTTKHGTQATMKTAAIGRQPPPAKSQPSVAVVKTAKQIEAEQIANDAHSDFDPLVELENANREIESLHAQLDAAEADDVKAEALKWRRLHQVAEKKQGELMDSAHRSQKESKWVMDQLRRCGKAVGEEDPAKIARAVEAAVGGRKAA